MKIKIGEKCISTIHLDTQRRLPCKLGKVYCVNCRKFIFKQCFYCNEIIGKINLSCCEKSCGNIDETHKWLSRDLLDDRKRKDIKEYL